MLKHLAIERAKMIKSNIGYTHDQLLVECHVKANSDFINTFEDMGNFIHIIHASDLMRVIMGFERSMYPDIVTGKAIWYLLYVKVE